MRMISQQLSHFSRCKMCMLPDCTVNEYLRIYNVPAGHDHTADKMIEIRSTRPTSTACSAIHHGPRLA